MLKILQVHPPKKTSVPKPSATITVRKARLKPSLDQNQPVGKRCMNI